LIFLESLEHFIELYLVNCILELLLSILSKRFRCSNESNQKAIRDRSSKVETADTTDDGKLLETRDVMPEEKGGTRRDSSLVTLLTR
jgi:hypothetical protein